VNLISKDGTDIAVARFGQGPPVVLVSGALGDRTGAAPLAALLAARFTVYAYDRRGRGDSGDRAPYAVEREIEDLAAVVAEAGTAAGVYGTSSGGNLALVAAAQGVPVGRLALWEPNFLVDASRPPLPPDYPERIEELVGSGRRGDAVDCFMTAAVGLPAEMVAPMHAMPMWPGMEKVAHTLAYDGRLVREHMSGRAPSPLEWAGVGVPALVVDGGQVPWLTAGADAIAAVLPMGARRTIAGQSHDVAAEAIAPVLLDFFGAEGR
jgi:pimeloyl-ACP methyl ester carboxylesterase